MSHTTTIHHGLDAGECQWKPGASFDCAFCGRICCFCFGVGDETDIFLGGICDDCWKRLPPHVHEYALEWYGRQTETDALPDEAYLLDEGP